MPIEFKLRDSARVALALSAAFPLSASALNAGRIDFAMGNVTALASDGKSRPLSKGSEFGSGETINTADGRAQLRFTDGSKVSLQPETQYRIDEYRFNGTNDGTEKGFFSLVKGTFRTVSGLVGRANRQAYKVTTSTATIGIRGTEYLVGEENGVTTISTGEGLVEVCTGAGCIVLASGESAVVTGKDGKPVRVSNKGMDTTNAAPSVVMGKPTDEGLALSSLASGPGYALAITGRRTYDGGEGITANDFINRHDSGTATFSGAGDLGNFVVDGGEGPAGAYTASMPTGALTDGIIGWGRWAAGQDSGNAAGSTYSGDNVLDTVHYVVGMPTSSADMSALSSKIGTYSVISSTIPTATSAAGITTNGYGAVTGNLMANFNTAAVTYSLANINVNGYTYGIGGTGGISGAGFSGGGTVTGGSAGGLNTQGFFFGANAARAGLVYQFSDSGTMTIRGAVAFTQTGLAPY